MKIRKAKYSDKKEVLDFCKNTFEWGDYIDRVWDSWISDSSGLLLVSEDYSNDSLKLHPIAISHISYCPNNFLWIEGLRVDKNYRKQGIASSLLKYMLNFGLQKGNKEANALVSFNNITSQKMLEKHGFSQLCIFNYYNVELKKIYKINFPMPRLKLKLKIPHPKDISLIIDYLCNSKVSKHIQFRYFNAWKFYIFENTYSSLFSLISNNKLLIIIDDLNNIHGVLIINQINSINNFFKEPLIQINYFDCVDYYTYIETISLLISFYCDNTQYCNIQFFLPDFIELSHRLCIETTNHFEQFILYNKKLIDI